MNRYEVGFIPGVQDYFNIWKSINVILSIKTKIKMSYDHFNRCIKSNYLTKLKFFSEKNYQKTKPKSVVLQPNKGHLQIICKYIYWQHDSPGKKIILRNIFLNALTKLQNTRLRSKIICISICQQQIIRK